MIRCRNEVTEFNADKKHEDSREVVSIAPRRLSFAELMVRDVESWRRIESVEELVKVAARVQRELKAGELAHFSAWVSGFHGAGMARAAGMSIAPLRAQLA